MIGRTVAIMVLAWACGPAAAQSTATLERRGEQLLSRHCAMCHAVGRTGSSPHAQAPPFRTLGRKYPVASLEEALGEGLMSGHPDMPEFKFPPADVAAIIAYLTSIQER
jgi:mono/diheme cytochrome c family protein